MAEPNLARQIGLLGRGERLPRIDTLLKLAGALGVRLEGPLLGGIRWRPGSVRRGSFALSGAAESAAERPRG